MKTNNSLLPAAVLGVVAAIAMSACGDGGKGGDDSTLQHVPEIGQVLLSPSEAPQMEGGGSVTVTTQVECMDSGLDIQTLYVRMPDGTTLEFGEEMATETGILTEQFPISTETVGVAMVEFWLEDRAGNRSETAGASFSVFEVPEPSEWTNRLSGLPYPLNDVIWDGTAFIAVGYGGTILTSVDGIDWVARETVVENPWESLYAVTAFGADIYAVGGPGIFLSTDHGATWTVVAQPDHFIGTAVAANSSQVVVMGVVPDLGIPRITISEDGGETWQTTEFTWAAGDLIYRDGLFVAPVSRWVPVGSGTRLIVSADGKQWSEMPVGEEDMGLNAILHDGSRFIVAGDKGTVYSSFDAFNWISLSTPLEDVDLSGAAWNGTQLVLAGRVSWYLNRRDDTYRAIGISSIDGGETWETFGIDSSYESHGLAWGNGRFVSVGRSVLSDEGAIYTRD